MRPFCVCEMVSTVSRRKCAGLNSVAKLKNGNSCRFRRGLYNALQNSKILICMIACCVLSLQAGPKEQKMSKVKTLGQIFTPSYLVQDILNLVGYENSATILKKHIIDNSCGDGAFLCEAVGRYCCAYRDVHPHGKTLRKELESFVHGIELDKSAFQSCLLNLDAVASNYGLENVKWDVKNANTLDVVDYDGKMDFVVGNPPYVRVHNLEESFDRVKKYRFCCGGMTDLYLVFYEIGLRMLASGGRLAYIAPSSWLNSVAGHNMREYAIENGTLRIVADLGHYQPFTATTYTAIVVFENGAKKEHFTYMKYESPHQIHEVAELEYRDAYFDDALYLGDAKILKEVKRIKTQSVPSVVEVKNGFATLADDVFIADAFPFSEHVIPVIKASTGKWRNALYPYDKNGKPLEKEKIFSNKAVSEYLLSHQKELLKGRSERDVPEWYLYGRTQALKDVWRQKYAINTVVRDKQSVKFNCAVAGVGVYSGLYILTDLPEDVIKDELCSDDFIDYIKILKKYKSGGYYTFSSKDVSQYLNFKLNRGNVSDENQVNEQSVIRKGGI